MANPKGISAGDVLRLLRAVQDHNVRVKISSRKSALPKEIEAEVDAMIERIDHGLRRKARGAA